MFTVASRNIQGLWYHIDDVIEMQQSIILLSEVDMLEFHVAAAEKKLRDAGRYVY